ncbi:energy transducer TonB [Aureibacter tunicatorum]|uniref:TonB family protein n=1 Tax=Aureibacter tunicatorum TaxID=866807 RepID=A0AAE3XRP5_9BACT|nr:energy transducer TonB [Aureibacter tunicatorum]MDR6241518.1 TonB family protein [Aureibacter tunicatorum]BDD07024.1 hypothetical protein AUTU_45070 [Aureibacter tunicatorum]
MSKNKIIKTVFYYTIVACTLFLSVSCKSQIANSVASFPGGKKQLHVYFKKNMHWQQGQHTVEGKVYISFLVTKNGKIVDVEVVKNLCESCDKEAIRLVKNMPNWTPAKKEGKRIDSQVTLSIYFKLYRE